MIYQGKIPTPMFASIYELHFRGRNKNPTGHMKKIALLSLVFFISLSHLFAQQTIGLFTNTTESFDGYTLFGPKNSTETYLINNCGEKVHSWSSQYVPGGSIYLLENGTLLRTAKTAGGPGGIGLVEMIDWNSTIIWSHSVDSTHGRQHHDVELLPNGNILLIVRDIRTQAEVIQAGSLTTQASVNSEQIIEIQPDLVNGGATVVWEWKAWEHLIQDADSTKDDYGVVSDHPNRVDINFLDHNSSDWLHMNGVDYNEEFDQIMLSVRDFSEFWIIDHSTTLAESADSVGGTFGQGGDILYRWGNPQAYNQGTPGDQKLFLQHHTHWIPENLLGAGKILMFNNRAGTPQTQNYSTVNTVELPVDTNGFYTYNGGAFGPANFDWTYQAPNPSNFFSEVFSGAQRLPNGNTLICEGVPGKFFEIDTNQNIVWEYVNPVNNLGPQAQDSSIINNQAFRCTRYAPDYTGFSGKSLVAQGYIETGSTFSCTLFAIGLTGSPFAENEFEAFPNPSEGVITFKIPHEQGEKLSLKIHNTTGQIVYEMQISTQDPFLTIDLNHLGRGVYFATILNGKGQWGQKILLTK